MSDEKDDHEKLATVIGFPSKGKSKAKSPAISDTSFGGLIDTVIQSVSNQVPIKQSEPIFKSGFDLNSVVLPHSSYFYQGTFSQHVGCVHKIINYTDLTQIYIKPETKLTRDLRIYGNPNVSYQIVVNDSRITISPSLPVHLYQTVFLSRELETIIGGDSCSRLFTVSSVTDNEIELTTENQIPNSEIIWDKPNFIFEASLVNGSFLDEESFSGVYPVLGVSPDFIVIHGNLRLSRIKCFSLADHFIKNLSISVDRAAKLYANESSSGILLLPQQQGIESEMATLNITGFVANFQVVNLTNEKMKIHLKGLTNE